jgi:16S rRNA (guanine527-N7)-methyltransferase
MMPEETFTERLLTLAGQAGVSLSPGQARMCYTHLRLMLEWNRKLNLTRITDPEEIITKHFLDSMIPARHLPQSGLALDVGTGPGFPGVPLKVLLPDLHVVLLEGLRKKVSFLRVLLSHLPCDSLWALQGKWEEFRRIDHPLAARRYSLITMRAVRLEPEHLSVLAADILDPGGVFAWWAGPSVRMEAEELDRFAAGTGLRFEEDYSYSLPPDALHRRLLTWRKVT